MNSRTLAYNIRFNLRKKLWFPAVVGLAFLFTMPINAGMTFQSFFATWRSEPLAAQKISHDMAKLFSAGDALPISLIFCIAAFAAGLIFFTWMHKRRQVDLYHSLPCTRARFFLGNYLSGVIAVLAPYLINLLLTVVVVAAMGLLPVLDITAVLAGAGLNILLFLLIYTLTVIAVTMTGNGVVSGILALVFLGIGPAVVGTYKWLREAMQPTWYSATDWSALVGHCSPVTRYATIYINQGFYDIGWLEALIMLALLAGLIWLAVRLYQARPSEAAGKALAFPQSRAFIKYPLVVLCSALFAMFLHEMGDINEGCWLWFFIGAFLGGVISAQLMEIIYHADFRAVGKRLVPLGVTLALFMGVCGLGVADVGGYNRYLPQADEVAKVELLLDGFNSYTSSSYINTGFYEYNSFGYIEESPHEYAGLRDYITTENRLPLGAIESPQAIAAAIDIAKQYINAKPPVQDENFWENHYYTYPQTTTAVIRYLMKDGSTVTRQYRATEVFTSDIAAQMRVIYDDPSYREHIYQLFSFAPEQIRFGGAMAFEATHIQQYDDSISTANLDKDCSELLRAYQQELKNLDSATMSEELPIGTISFQVYSSDPGKVSKHTHRQSCIRLEYPIYAGFTKTIALLADFGLKPEYWYPDTAAITTITVSEYDRNGFPQQNNNNNSNNNNNNSQELPSSAYQNQKVNNATLLAGDRETVYFLEKSLPLQKVNDHVTYYYPGNKERSTIYRDSEEIAGLVNSSYPENAFYYNSFISAEPNTMLSVC